VAATKCTENNAFTEVAGNSYRVTHACVCTNALALAVILHRGGSDGKSKIALSNNESGEYSGIVRKPGIDRHFTRDSTFIFLFARSLLAVLLPGLISRLCFFGLLVK